MASDCDSSYLKKPTIKIQLSFSEVEFSLAHVDVFIIFLAWYLMEIVLSSTYTIPCFS